MAEPTVQRPFLSIAEAAAQLGYRPDAAYKMIRSGVFPVEIVKVGTVLKVRRTDLERFIAGDWPKDAA